MAVARKVKASAVPVLPRMDGEAYTAEVLAPVVTAWLTEAGLPPIDADYRGIDLRGIVRNGPRRGVASPIPRLRDRPADGGTRTHRYTLTEAADLLVAVAVKEGRPDLMLPLPFRGHHSGTATGTRKASVKGQVTRRKADPTRRRVNPPTVPPTTVTEA